MSYDGQAEVAAILARLRTILDGRIYEQLADDDDSIGRDSMGRVLPHAIVYFGETILDDTERTLDSDGAQPFLLPVSIQWIAPTPEILRSISAAGKRLFVDWRPTPGSDYMQAGVGGMAFPTLDAQSRPTRFNRLAHYPVRVNLSSAA